MRGIKNYFRPLSGARGVRTLGAAIPTTETAAAAVTITGARAKPLSPRDEAIFLLHTAAEVEHALMAQYLYAAYSLITDPAQQPKGLGWQREILGIAREEMGHLMTVENILLALGGPVNFEREDYPFQSRLYPFKFHLERVTLGSLGRYVLAEMPVETSLSATEAADVARIRMQLGEAAGPHRVGELYDRLIKIVTALAPGDFDASVASYQALEEDWVAAREASPGSFQALVPRVTSREEALAALTAIAEQGEGTQRGPEENAHFDRFLRLYREIETAGGNVSHEVPTDPDTARFAADACPGTITHPQARRWAEFSNTRYRQLLAFLAHFLQTPGALYTETGERTARGYLAIWAFFEMRNLALIQRRIVQLPQHEPATAARAAIPFELPYTLALPVRERDRWRFHRQIAEAAMAEIAALRAGAAEDPALLARLEGFTDEQVRVAAVLEGGALPEPAPLFRRVIQILEEAVRGFDIAAGHGNFWRADSEAELIAKLGDKVEPGKPAESQLIDALRGNLGFAGRMPLGRPAIPEVRIAVIERWIASLTPAAPPPPPPPPVPRTRFEQVVRILDDAVQNRDFGAHRRFWIGMTRDRFVAHPVFGFALINLGDGNGSSLVKALRGELPFGMDTGTAGASFRRMPAGRPMVPADQIEFIRAWIDDGCPEDMAEPAVDPAGGGAQPGALHNDYWREFDDWALFNVSPEVNTAIGAWFQAFPLWFAFAKGTATEAQWAAAIAPPPVQDALRLLSTRQMETVAKHYGSPVAFLSVLDGYEKFGDSSLPPDALRPADPRHTMNGPQMWFVWSAFADACIRSGVHATFWRMHVRAVLAGAMNDGLFRGRFTVNGFTADAAGKAAMAAHLRGLAPEAVQAEARTRFADSGM